MRLWDISASVDAGSPVFPGDSPYRPQWAAVNGKGSPVHVSAVTLSPRLGTHAVAPIHHDAAGTSIGVLDLAPYFGPCRVIHAWGMRSIGRGERLVRWAHIAHRIDADLPPRVLLRTCERASVERFDPDYPAFAPETIERLADLHVQLIGIDTARIDPADSTQWPSHQAIQRRGLRVLGGLVLDAVPEGDYELIALPMKWMGADASPVRAVLREAPRPARSTHALPAPDGSAFADTPFENSRPRDFEGS